MRLSSLALAVLVMAWATESVQSKKNLRHRREIRDVCVVGGGPGGVYAARALEEKGYDVVLFEKENSLGGKTVPSTSDDGTMLVRHLITSGMERVLQYKEAFGLPSFPIPGGTAIMPDGSLRELASFPPPSQAQLQAIAQYVETLSGELFQEINDPDHLGVSEELMVDLRSWLQSQGMSALEPLLYLTVTNFGYGLQQQVPAIYLLKYYGIQSFLDAVQRKYDLFPMHLMIQGLGATLQDVRLGTPVRRIVSVTNSRRRGKRDGERFRTLVFPANGAPVLCKNTVLAFPQVESAMGIVKNLRRSSKRLFQQVKNVFYYEAILKNVPADAIAGPTSYSRFFEPTGDTSLPNIYSRLTPTSDVIALFNSGYERRDPVELVQIIQDHVKLVFNYTLADADVVLYKEHTYMPHVLEPEMKAGFYDKLDKIQGDQGLFFVGGLLDFELVDNVLRSTEKIVDRFF